MRSPISKAHLLIQLLPIHKSKKLSLTTKLRLFEINTTAAILCGCETWRRTKNIKNLIQVFINMCLRKTRNIKWKINEELWQAKSLVKKKKKKGSVSQLVVHLGNRRNQ